MTEPPSPAETIEHWAKRVMENDQSRKLIGEQTERFWKAEDSLVSDFHEYLDGWFKRRHDAARSAIEFGQLMGEQAEGAVLIKAWTELWSKAMQRFNEDAQAQAEFIRKLAANAAPNEFAMEFPLGPMRFVGNERNSEKEAQLHDRAGE